MLVFGSIIYEYKWGSFEKGRDLFSNYYLK